MVPGYRVSHEDCEVPPPVLLTTLSNTLYLQVCGYTGGPLLLRATTLASIADSAVPRSLALLDLAIQVTRDRVKTTFLIRGDDDYLQGLDTSVMLACPDMLFLTRHSVGREVLGPGVTRAEWRQLATKHQLQGVRTR